MSASSGLTVVIGNRGAVICGRWNRCQVAGGWETNNRKKLMRSIDMEIDSVNMIEVSVAHDLARLAEYATGAVVSREIVKKGAGTLTVFAFDEGQGISEHSAPFDAIVQVLDGESEWTIGGKKVTCNEGQIMIMPADVPHAVKAVRRFKMLLTMLKSDK